MQRACSPRSIAEAYVDTANKAVDGRNGAVELRGLHSFPPAHHGGV